MSLITHVLEQDASIQNTTLNKNGEQVIGSETAVKCRFKNVTQLESGLNREGVEAFDAILWFEANAPIVEGTIIFCDGGYWRVNRLIKARKLAGPNVEFLKALVNKYKLPAA